MKFSDIPKFTQVGSWECDFTLNEFVERIEEWEKEENLELNPDFQRGHIWNEDQQIKYIEFILRGGKNARIVYFNHPGWSSGTLAKKDEFVCVDGLQRITAVKRFIHNEIKAFDHYFNEFEGSLRTMQGMRININSLQTKKEVLQWYIEMNEGGTPHSKEEIEKVKRLLKEEE
jgi:Protein of unknown function DUF262.